MRAVFLGIIVLMHMPIVEADINKCGSEIVGYKAVKNSVYPFVINKEKACFFAFY